jgi:hypothetical protein
VTTFEVGTKGGRIMLILSVNDDDAGAISATGISMAPDDAKALCNAVGGAIKELAEEVRT